MAPMGKASYERILAGGGAFYLLIRFLGLVLLVAAVAKSFDPLLAIQRPSLLRSPGFFVLIVETEVLLGMWFTLAPAVSPLWTWRVALAWSTALTGIAAYFTVTGQRCGCFGKGIAVEPWHLLVFDAVVIAGLWVCRPNPLARLAGAVARCRLARAACGALVVGVSLGSVAAARAGTPVIPGLVYLEQNNAMVLEPGKWLGRPFPLSRYAKIGHDLAHGRWAVVLYRHDCPVCMAFLREVEHRGMAGYEGNTALLEIPPCGGANTMGNGVCHGRLDVRLRWFAETPVLLELQDSLVTAVANKTQIDAWMRERTAHFPTTPTREGS